MPCEFKIGSSVHSCQFHDSYKEEDLIKTEEGLYCPLHLPLNYKTQLFTEKDFYDLQNQIEDIIENITNSKDLDFRGVQFPGDFIAPEMNLQYSYFDEAVFHDIANFSNMPMSDSKLSERISIAGSIYFNGAVFGGSADFTKITAFQSSSFCKAEFKSFARFKHMMFYGHTDFSKTIFCDYANFKNTRYLNPFYITKGAYIRSAMFDEAIFEGRSDFSESIFPERTSFKKCKFARKNMETSGIVSSFRNAHFGKKTDFSDCTFYLNTDFGRKLRAIDDDPDFQQINFENTVFEDDVSFENRYFASKTSFKNTVFIKAPLIYNVKLNEDVDFNGSKFNDLKSENAHRTYEILKKHMANNQREAAIAFYLLEQRSLRYRKSIPDKILSWLDDKTSSYGYNWKRPFLFLLITLFTFLFFYTILFQSISATSEDSSINIAINFFIQQIIAPYELWQSETLDLIKYDSFFVTVLIKMIASLNSLFVYIFSALFLITLKRQKKAI